MTAKEWFKVAEEEGFAIGAFNVDSLEIFRGICIAAKAKKSPVMLEFSSGEIEYFGIDNIVDLVKNARKEYEIPILLNLDHARSVEECLTAINVHSRNVSGSSKAHSGSVTKESVVFDDVHFDGSELDLEKNIENTKKVVEAAHEKELLVEGEMDRVPGSSEVHAGEVDPKVLAVSYTDPKAAAEFVEKTGVDIFAGVFGNVHGTFSFEPKLDLELLKKIRDALPETFLSMHGGSGISAEDVRNAIATGKIVKVNVNTELRQAFVDSLVEKVNEQPRQYTYYKMAGDVALAVAAVVEGKIEIFGSEGKA